MATTLYYYTYTVYMVLLWLIAFYTLYHYHLSKVYSILIIFPLAAFNESLGLLWKVDVVYNFLFSLLQSLCFLAMLRHFIPPEDMKRVAVIWLFLWCMGCIIYVKGGSLQAFYLLEAVVWLLVYIFIILKQKHIQRSMVLAGASLVLIDTYLNILVYVLYLNNGISEWHPLYDSALHIAYAIIFMYTGYQLYYYHQKKSSAVCSPTSSSSL
jgi:hypothetical protein